MKNTVRIIVSILLTVLLVVSAANTALALSTAEAKELIDTSELCSMTLTYDVDDKKLEGLVIEIYQSATVSENFQYSLTGDFAQYSIDINAVKSQSEWDAVSATIGAYITADRIDPLSSQTTDENGIVKFDNLPVGMYYVRWTGNEIADQVSSFSPFMIAVPNLGEDGKWIYDVTAFPKPGSLPEPETDTLTLVKLWKDGNYSEKRPTSISVDIYRDGAFFESIELNAEQNWSYSWTTNGVHEWTVVERDIPAGYRVSIQNKDGKTFQITNTNDDNPPYSPPTGDSSFPYVWIMLMCFSGIVLILLGSKWRRRSVAE